MSDLATLIANGPPAGADEDAPQPIGGFVGERPAGHRFNDLYGQQARSEKEQAAARGEEWTPPTQPIYFEGDERIPASYALEDVRAIQRGMARAGLLTGRYRDGIWDKASRNAFSELLGYANQQGVEWADALTIYASSEQRGGPAEAGYTREQFLPRDPAEYREAVRELFRTSLRRDPTDAELGQFEQMLRSSEQEAFDVEQDMAANQYEAQAQGLEEAPPTDAVAVNPMSRVTEFFERKYGGAIEDTADDEHMAAAGNASQGLSTSMQQVI